MHPRLSDDVGFSYATFNEKGAKRVRLDDFIPWLRIVRDDNERSKSRV
jgi:hypothetical protein